MDARTGSEGETVDQLVRRHGEPAVIFVVGPDGTMLE